MPERPLASSVMTTSFGLWLAVASDKGLVALNALQEVGLEAGRARVAARFEFALVDDAHPLLNRLSIQLNAYLHGKLHGFSLPLDLRGTPFQRRVWDTLQTIPYGQTISYAELALQIGQPQAVRASAHACARNPVALVVPCHRVIAADAKLGGYAGGLALKRRLLSLEGAAAGSLPLFSPVRASSEAPEGEGVSSSVRDGLPSELGSWLSIETFSPATESIDPGTWSDAVMPLLSLAESVALVRELSVQAVSGHERALLGGRELLERVLISASSIRLSVEQLRCLLDASLGLESLEALNTLIGRVVNAPGSPEALRQEARAFLEGLMAGEVAAPQLREAAVDLWLSLASPSRDSELTVTTTEDPSLIYEQAGLWQEAALVAEQRLAQGLGSRVELLKRLVVLYKRLGQRAQAREHQLSLALERRDPDDLVRLREFEDELVDE